MDWKTEEKWKYLMMYCIVLKTVKNSLFVSPRRSFWIPWTLWTWNFVWRDFSDFSFFRPKIFPRHLSGKTKLFPKSLGQFLWSCITTIYENFDIKTPELAYEIAGTRLRLLYIAASYTRQANSSLCTRTKNTPDSIEDNILVLIFYQGLVSTSKMNDALFSYQTILFFS